MVSTIKRNTTEGMIMAISDQQFSIINRMRDLGDFDGCDTVTQSKVNGEVYVRWPEKNGSIKTIAIAQCGTVTVHHHKRG